MVKNYRVDACSIIRSEFNPSGTIVVCLSQKELNHQLAVTALVVRTGVACYVSTLS